MLRLVVVCVSLPLLCGAADCSATLDKYCSSVKGQGKTCEYCYFQHRLQLLTCKSADIQAYCDGPVGPTPPPTPWTPSGRRPRSPQNLTVFGLRPYELPDLNDKDTADALGDVYFWMVDKVLMPYTCREDPSFMLCNSSKIIGANQVYEQSVLEIDGSRVGQYALCNPSTSDPTGHTWRCEPEEPQFGAGNVNGMYGNCSHEYYGRTYDTCRDRAGKPVQYMLWRTGLANHLQGWWYSTQHSGNCDDASTAASGTCYWRIAHTVKVANATCVNSRISELVQSTGKTCFAGCGASADPQSDCYITCFMETVLGKATATEGVYEGGISKEQIVNIFNKAFESEDEHDGGCPALPPYVPPTTTTN